MPYKADIPDLVKKLPQKPGVYQFFNQSGEIIYIGKAKNIRKRVASYFKENDNQSYKLNVLTRKIDDIKYILVENESDALLLENNLIKEYQPRYNILLKDDKTYPWLCIKLENFPRVFSTRTYITDGSEYFGPYTSGLMVKTLLVLIRQLYKLRTCNLLLTEENITKGKYKRCLEFHLGNCKGPCEGLQDKSDYDESIGQIKEILRGNLQQVIKHLRTLMENYAGKLLFEEAEIVKNKIIILERFQSKSTIVNKKIRHVDVFSFIDEPGFAYINFLKVVDGAIVQAHNIEVIKKLDEEPGDILSSVIYDLHIRFRSQAKEVIVPFMPEINMEKVTFCVPKIGDKLKLLELSTRNASSFRNDRNLLKAVDKWKEQESNLLEKVKEDLRLKEIPHHIECFDNSNIQGSNPVASCVVFKSGKPNKSEYRHFNVKTVEGANDFASMEEIVIRRYKRCIEENRNLPHLIIVDGGKGQLSAAVKSLKRLNIYGKVSVIGIAKRLEEIYVPEDSIPLYLDKNSSTLRLIQRIRDEAHRFGIAFHRKKRSQAQLESSFTNIPGIGDKTRDRILRKESDIEVLKRLSVDKLVKIAGKRAGIIMYEFFHKDNAESDNAKE